MKKKREISDRNKQEHLCDGNGKCKKKKKNQSQTADD